MTPGRRWLIPPLALVLLATVVTASEYFRDVEDSSVVDDVDWLAREGLTDGCSAEGDRFCPEQPVTRGQMAAFLARALELDGDTDKTFSDVDPESIFAADIDRLVAAGITSGCGDGSRFCPQEPITRGQMAVFLARGFDFEELGEVYFGDVEPASVYEDDINRIATAGVTAGCRDGGDFCPTETVTRGQMAAFLRRAITSTREDGEEVPDDAPSDEDSTSPPEAPTNTPDSAPGDTPTAATTGVPDGTSLREVERITTSQDGEVIEGVVTSGIEVRHNDVTIRNTRVEGEGMYGIFVPSSQSGDIAGLLIEDSEIIGTSGDRAAGLAQYGDWTARRIEVRGYQDAVKVGSDQVLEDSLLHELYTPSGAHADGIQSVGGHDVVIRNNRIAAEGGNAAMIIQSDNREVGNYRIEGNLLSGGNFTLFLRDKEHGAPQDMVVTNNTWIDDTARYGPVSLDEGSGWLWEGNGFEDGTTVQ